MAQGVFFTYRRMREYLKSAVGPAPIYEGNDGSELVGTSSSVKSCGRVSGPISKPWDSFAISGSILGRLPVE
jgi:hypothetical protein